MPILNPVGTDGFDFLEFTTTQPEKLITQFISLGFQPVATHKTCPVTIYQQNDIRFIINLTDNSHASQYVKSHGTSVSAIGFKVRDARIAMQHVIMKGATGYQPLNEILVYDIPAIYAVGNTLIYFVDYRNGHSSYVHNFSDLPSSSQEKTGTIHLDHITHHLYHGHLVKWIDFYTRLFSFRKQNHPGPKDKKTGLKIREMISPCGKIRLPLQESADESFLNTLKGEGIKHISLDNDKNNIIFNIKELDT